MTVSRAQTQARIDKLAAGTMKHTPEQGYTVADRFEEHARNFPDRLFLIVDGQHISYGELNAQANRYAGLMRQQGLAYGDVAALMMENRAAFIYAWLGLAKIGVITALINTQSRGKALHHALETTRSKLLLAGAECLANVQASAGVLEQVASGRLKMLVVADPLLAAPAALPAAALPVEPLLIGMDKENPDPALRAEVIGEYPLFYVFTSGTTGLPKAAILSHMRWLAVGDGWASLLDIRPDDVFYCISPLFHGAAGMSLLSNAVAAGAAVVVRRRFSASQFWPDVRRYGVTTVQYIGEIGRYLLNQPAQPDDRQHPLKRMTGAGLNRDVWQRFLERFGDVEIYEGWGATEANCSMINLDGVIGACGRIPFRERANGRLVKYDIEADDYVRNQQGFLLECEPGEVGELIGMILAIPGLGAGRFEGYTDAAVTERKILRNVFTQGDAWYRSGDLFTRDADDYFYFVDRIGDTFRWKSENVSTQEMVEALGAYAAAETINAYGVAVPDHEGRAGMVALQMRPDNVFDGKAFYRIAAQNLPVYAMPLFVRVGNEADITATFKLRKVELQRQGYDPLLCRDDLYVCSREAETYLPYSAAVLAALGLKPFAAEREMS